MKRESVKKTTALLLMSGGLDSILAAKLLLEQGVEVTAVCFYSSFFGCELARKAAKQIEIALKEVDISKDIIEVLKSPKHGYGSAINPCIDCHALMLKKAGEIMRKGKFDFVATGEVLGERPMSQNKRALKIVEKEAGLEGYLLRPLSAKLLEPTMPEINRQVTRDDLMDISGRNRKPQTELAEKFGIREYPTPGGGCMLTQTGFAKRLRELMENKSDFKPKDAELIKIGRHFWIDGMQIILGRNKEENEAMAKAAGEKNILIEPENFVGPAALIRGEKMTEERMVEVLEKTKELMVKFSPKLKENNDSKFRITKGR